MSTFWRWLPPLYSSEYRSVVINGRIEHPFSLPTVRCEVCDQRSYTPGTLPLACPPCLRRNKFLRDYDDDLSMAAFQRLVSKLVSTLPARDRRGVPWRPGLKLQPAFVDLPSCPESDVLWPSPGSLLVSARLRSVLRPWLGRTVRTCPITLRRVGRRRPQGPFREPRSGEPEDLIPSVGRTRSKALPRVSAYYEMILLDQVPDPPGIPFCPLCPLCGERVYRDTEGEHWREVYEAEKQAWARLDQEGLARLMGNRSLALVNGAILSSTEIRHALEQANVSNLRFAPFP
ncbi:MAG: hypothetical protein IT580_00490 [Verrucomicrobiales bacterium]|nr:hypothetical protein [Verrucomicrobiales bacterium]